MRSAFWLGGRGLSPCHGPEEQCSHVGSILDDSAFSCRHWTESFLGRSVEECKTFFFSVEEYMQLLDYLRHALDDDLQSEILVVESLICGHKLLCLLLDDCRVFLADQGPGL